MFDWNDEELTNIIWGEGGESDDHIVPYPDQIEEKPPVLFGDPSKKETNQQISNVSPVEQKKPIIKSEHEVELDGSSKYDISEPATGFGMDSWPEGPGPSSSNAAKADQGSLGTAASSNITKGSKSGSSRDDTPQFDKDSEIFENPPEDGEQGDFVDYGWANIGSFDDLDRIFSNNDPIFGDIGVGNTDELWSSSKDVTSSPLGPIPLSGDSSDLPLGALRTSTDRSESKAQYMLDPSQSFMSEYDKLNEITSHTPQDVQASIDTVEHSGGKSELVEEKTFVTGGEIQACQQLNDRTTPTLGEFAEKGNRQKRLLKGQKLDKKSEVRQLHDLSGTWTSSGSPLQQVNIQYATSMVNACPPLALAQQMTLQRPEPFQQKNFASAPLASPLYGNMVNHYPATSVLAQFRPGEGSRELVSSYEVSPANANSLKTSEDASVKPPAMTPKEKIEKLRRRQQMRAILAIQKQQLQFGNQVTVSEHSSMEGGKTEVDESFSSFPSLEPNSPIEQDDSNTISMAFDNYSVEESVLYRLQDTIAKLDIRIRLCIRDSLFRLAQSAMQRQYANDTSSASTSSRDEVLSNKDIVSQERFPKIPDVETDTNPIDRTVAHLLFHRPMDFSGKPGETPESPLSANIPYERKANPLKSSAKGYFPETFENTQMTSPQGSKSPGIFSKTDQSRNAPCFIPSENAPKNENAGQGQKMIETSK
ncbi:protein LNK2 isoform X2 [Sesamum indicum]|uniref:Protein LNK2 isoform X2 n=1 Tax=Sesamum indicum TaxID=4182 RepID=A0A6I9U3N8_SESIN|nr:protein LNK2 isoform X2 [Sesamum indicum]